MPCADDEGDVRRRRRKAAAETRFMSTSVVCGRAKIDDALVERDSQSRLGHFVPMFDAASPTDLF
jgi:hypothetical protein